MTNQWNPKQYNKFKEQRAKPFFDLLKLLDPTNIGDAVDLGCGTGELTRHLYEAVKPKTLLGVDSSARMLKESERFKTSDLQFELGSIESFVPSQTYDLIFSNAALQWIPGHETLFKKIFSWMDHNSQLAIQMPYNFDHPSHNLAFEIAATLFPKTFTKESVRSVMPVEWYAQKLYEEGFKDQVARLEVYGHPMASGLEVLEWTKGTLLTQYQSKLTEKEFETFLEHYKSELINVIGTGPYFYTFKRMLIWGKK